MGNNRIIEQINYIIENESIYKNLNRTNVDFDKIWIVPLIFIRIYKKILKRDIV